MKKNILLLICSLFFSLAISAQSKMIEANKLYNKEQYKEAAALYEEALNKDGESASLYYNLGNTYYKLNKIAPAILNYERVLLLDPSNENASFNLELCHLRVVDKINSVDHFFLKRWIDSLANFMSSDSWARFSVITFLIFIVSLFAYVFGRYRLMRKTAFFFGCFIFIVSLSSFGFAKMQKNKLTSHDHAIIFDDSVTVKGSPDESGTDLFLLHEGTKVKIKSTFGNNDWTEIQLEDGNTGWVKSKTIEVI
jgi:tetratricopeptide (TPR) repeat protein